MDLSLTIIDERTKPPKYGIGHAPEVEECDRVKLVALTGSPQVIAATLRGIADDLVGVHR